MKNFKYIGFDIIHTDSRTIEIVLQRYFDSIKPIQIHDSRKKLDSIVFINADKKEKLTAIGLATQLDLVLVMKCVPLHRNKAPFLLLTKLCAN